MGNLRPGEKAERLLQGRGFTLVEIIFVVLCLFLLMGPVFSILRSGTKSSLKGMMQVETTLAARNILRQIRQDLRHSCFAYSGKGCNFNVETLIKSDPAGGGCSFLAFPHQGSPGDASERDSSNLSWRLASHITYSVVPNSTGTGFSKLVRKEKFHPKHPSYGNYPGGECENVLTANLLQFQIKPEIAKSGKESALVFLVNISLIDSVPGKAAEAVSSVQGGLIRPREGAIAEFFDLVTSEFYHAMKNRSGYNLNWQTGIEGP